MIIEDRKQKGHSGVMIRKLFVCILMFTIVCVLSGCGSQSELKEEDMVSAESVLQKGIPNDYGDALLHIFHSIMILVFDSHVICK